jgi:hypothetical protein
MLFLELGQLLFHVLVLRAWSSLDFLGDLLARLNSLLGPSLDLLGTALHFFDGLK